MLWAGGKASSRVPNVGRAGERLKLCSESKSKARCTRALGVVPSWDTSCAVESLWSGGVILQQTVAAVTGSFTTNFGRVVCFRVFLYEWLKL